MKKASPEVWSELTRIRKEIEERMKENERIVRNARLIYSTLSKEDQ